MKKSTRHAFSRKAVSLALCLFVVAALITTGFAAWLLSSDSQDSVSGNVTASAVNDQSLTITINDETALGTIQFAPAQDDNKGAVRFDPNESDDYEKLSVQLSGSFTNFDRFGSLEVTVKVTDAILHAAGYTWTGEGNERVYTYAKDTSSGSAVTARAYIKLPSYARDQYGNIFAGEASSAVRVITYDATAGVTDSAYPSGGALAASITVGSGENNPATFSLGVEFGWGEYFNYVNPGFDGDSSNEASPLEKLSSSATTQADRDAAMTEIKAVLEDMKSKLTHVAETNVVNYDIVLTAKAK